MDANLVRPAGFGRERDERAVVEDAQQHPVGHRRLARPIADHPPALFARRYLAERQVDRPAIAARDAIEYRDIALGDAAILEGALETLHRLGVARQ